MGTLLNEFIYDHHLIYKGEHFPIIHFTTIMVSDIAIFLLHVNTKVLTAKLKKPTELVLPN